MHRTNAVAACNNSFLYVHYRELNLKHRFPPTNFSRGPHVVTSAHVEFSLISE